MASFPTSAVTFAAISNGAVIQATDIGNPRDEIVAIEDGYLNGTARLNSSNSTVANLSVTGGSTFAGTITFASSVTFSTRITLSTFNISIVPAVKVTHSAQQNVVSDAWTGLNWDTQASTNAPMHSTVTNSSRITFVQSTGLYQVGTTVEWSTNVGLGGRVLRLMLNDASAFASHKVGGTGIESTNMPMSVVGTVRVASTTDYATVQVLQTSGSTASIAALSTSYGGSFWAHKLTNR